MTTRRSIRIACAVACVAATMMSAACDEATPTPIGPSDVPGPAVTSVSPRTGVAGGATNVRIEGSGFLPGAKVTMDGAAANVVVVNSTTITATTPVHAAGIVAVVVTNPDGKNSSLPGAFTFTPTPDRPAVATFHVSGVVTNEEGQPLPNNLVVLNHVDHFDDQGRAGLPVMITKVTTDASGRYAVDIQAIPNLYTKPGLQQIIADGYARADSSEYSNDYQFVTGTNSNVIRNFRLNRVLNPAVGESIPVTFLPDDGVCTWDDSYNTLCRYVRVTVPGEGMLTMSAVPLSSDTTPITFVVLETDDRLPWHGGAGTMNYPVKNGVEFLIALNMRAGFSQARPYTLTTSFRADNKGRLDRRTP